MVVEGGKRVVRHLGRAPHTGQRADLAERLLAEARGVADSGAPVDIRATLPGLVVAINVAEGDEVAGAALLTPRP